MSKYPKDHLSINPTFLKNFFKNDKNSKKAKKQVLEKLKKSITKVENLYKELDTIYWAEFIQERCKNVTF